MWNTETFLKKVEENGYRELEPNDWTSGVRVGSEDERLWFDVVACKIGLRVELIHAYSGKWEDLLALLVDFADEHHLKLEVKDWRKRDDLPVDFPGSRFTQVLKRNGFKAHSWAKTMIREPFPN